MNRSPARSNTSNTNTNNGQAPETRSTQGKATTQEPQEYAKRISEYSKLSASASLFAGAHFDNLASYLNQPFSPRAPNLMQEQELQHLAEPFEFVTLYDLDPARERKARHLNSVKDFEAEISPLIESSTHGHMLFLRGHPSPEWLLSIGTKYQVDPEYFQRYLDFFLGQPEHFPLPALPSTALPMVKLRTTTIGGSQNPPKTSDKQGDLQDIQGKTVKAKKEYRETLRTHKGCNLGDSIVRECSIHDLCHFSLEQDIFINVCRTKRSWACEYLAERSRKKMLTTEGLVWIDVGNPLEKGPASTLSVPLRRKDAWQTQYLPVVQYKPGVGLRSKSKLLAPVTAAQRGQSNMVQSAALLHLDYGRSLDRHVMSNDSFYALHELFMFAAFSEAQFLNMLASKLDQELEHSALVWHKSAALSNLVYHQQILDRHIYQLRENEASIKEALDMYAERLKQGDDDKLREAMASAKRLHTDYKHLEDRALKLLGHCDRGVQVVMNNAVIKESREAMLQAEGVVKLTRLAFVFIPLSFTTSFFGMNFKEFGTGSQSIWEWFVASLPILTVAILLMRYDVSVLWRRRGGTKGKDVEVAQGATAQSVEQQR